MRIFVISGESEFCHFCRFAEEHSSEPVRPIWLKLTGFLATGKEIIASGGLQRISRKGASYLRRRAFFRRWPGEVGGEK